jgi:hypothetical protein
MENPTGRHGPQDPRDGGASGDGSQWLLRSALMASAEAQVLLDREGRLVLANRHADERLGLAGRHLGCPVEELPIPLELRDHLEHAREQRAPLWVHDVLGRDDRGVRCYDVEVVPLTGGDPREHGWTVILHDCSQPTQPDEPVEPAVPGAELGEVSVVDLFVILVEHHRFEVREAVRRLTVGLLASGYPEDSERVSASDAMGILEDVLRTP